ALQAAYTEMKAKFSGEGVSFILMEQKPAGTELIIGSTESPGLGNLILFGLGGIFVEVMRDVATAVTPLSRPEARELMKCIQGYPMLEGVRGQKGVDLEALEDALLRVSRLVADFPQIVEMDLNPVFAYPAGQAPSVVDVRMKIR
ncbi:MAG: hypothetical protein GY953_26415, partial [bacterium]|nr:hypothetical protein [bacterium]